MKLHRGGPIEFVGPRYKRSIPPNITRVRSKNAAKDMGIMRANSSVRWGEFRVKVQRLLPDELVDTSLYRQCPKLKTAKALAKLFLEPKVLRWRGLWLVRCV